MGDKRERKEIERLDRGRYDGPKPAAGFHGEVLTAFKQNVFFCKYFMKNIKDSVDLYVWKFLVSMCINSLIMH